MTTTSSRQTVTPTNDQWFIGSNGNHFFDWGGFRYCAVFISTTNAAKRHYEVRRNGLPISVGGFKKLEDAKAFIETHSGYCGRRV